MKPPKENAEVSCETCAFFGKPFLCVRRESDPRAEPCLSYNRKTSLQNEAIYPLVHDTRLGRLKEESIEVTGPSILWYLVPFFFGILGGIVAYIGVKNENKEMADSLLVFGIIWTIILMGIYLYILAVI